MESIAEIRHRISQGGPKARPVTYKGVDFRSRLEVRYALHLDDNGIEWRYEPRVYGHDDRWYLPDFEIIGPSRPTFIEVKPKLDEVDGAKAKMAVIWDEIPDALLIVACAENCAYFAAERDSEWETWQERWASK
jgi:hypothetical protein